MRDINGLIKDNKKVLLVDGEGAKVVFVSGDLVVKGLKGLLGNL